MKARTGLLVAALLTLVVGGSATAATKADQQLRKVTVAMIAADPTGQVMYAKHRGFFRQQGLDVEIRIVADGTQTVPALLSGQAQFTAIPTGGLAALKSNGGPVRAVAGGALYEPGVATTVVMAAPGERIRRPRDLVGKRVAVDFRNSIAHIGLLRWLKRGGVSGDDVDISFNPFPLLVSPLLRGQLDAAWLPEPFATVAQQRGAGRLALPFDSVCTQECLLTLFIARRDVDPELAARFRNAVQAAAVWANQKRNHPASAAILARYAPIAPGIRSKMARSAYATRLRPRLGQPWIELYAEFDLIPDSYSWQDLLR
jgi:NitT/TauT family transport system substrate-binding protein